MLTSEPPMSDPPSFPLRQLGDVCAGDHICCLCANDEEKWNILAEFFRIGYQRKEKMLYLRQVSTREQIITSLEEGGFENIWESVASGQFVIKHYTESYLINGIFNPDEMMAKIQIDTDKALAEGYTALRATGEMSWVYMEENLTDKLIKYESMLNNFFPDRFSGICMYDTRIFEPGIMLKILSTHPQAIIHHQLFHNIYYMPPEDFLSTNVERSMLDRWMTNIEERHRVEEQLVAAKFEAEKAVQAKSSFLATMSHEIRNPINGIIGSVDMLGHTEVADEQKDLVTIIQSSAKHLYKVVNDVLDFSKIESGKLELFIGTVLVPALVRDAINLCQYSTQRNLEVTLKSDVHPSCPNAIIGDETRLRQILVNLIGNACKFTEAGEVVVSVAPMHNPPAKEEDKIWLEFSVADSGSGISDVDQAHLFQRFTQIDVSRKWAGTGLGLSICKQLVDAMKGKIFVKSSIIGKGSTFSFCVPFLLPPSQDLQHSRSLPSAKIAASPSASPDTPKDPSLTPSTDSTAPASAAPASATPASATPASAAPDSSANSLRKSESTPSVATSVNNLSYDFSDESVLVVEDNITNQKILKHMLNKLRCKIDIASDGFQAMQKASQNIYTLVFMDQCMPKCDGVTAVKFIREFYTHKGQAVPKLIAFSGTHEPRLMKLVDDVLLKPVQFETLLKIVSKYCKNKFVPE